MQTHLHTILRLGRNSYVILGDLARCGLDLIEPLQESHGQVTSPSQRVLLSKTNTILMSVCILFDSRGLCDKLRTVDHR
jgi:hypothetical protein